MSSRERPGVSRKPPRQASRCEGISGVCAEWGPYDSLGELKLWCAHHEVKQSAHGPVPGIRFPRFQILEESFALVFWNGSLEKARAEISHEFGWFAAKFSWNNFADVNRVAPRDIGERRAAAKAQVGPFLFRRIGPRPHRIAVDQVVREIVAEEESRCVHPRFAAIPAFHIRWREKNLAHLPHRILRHGRGRQFSGEQLRGLDEILDGALDLIAHGRVRIKFSRSEDLAQDGTHLEVVLTNPRGNRIDDLRGRLVFREEAPEFPGEKLRTRGLLHQNIDDVVTVPRARFPHECFWTEIVLPRSEPKLLVRHV